MTEYLEHHAHQKSSKLVELVYLVLTGAGLACLQAEMKVHAIWLGNDYMTTIATLFPLYPA
ncbi:hypothetical protein JCM19239_6503 [Vibrio variabilis]|uniref:Uncharacterized protein n=1 Tax=Vibrio variabilis TaxID=990271 RepID=A0ABQ0JNM4_9VIBR|nr:hypothetical protein JCM19239_6503 [Vibrio variabilis]